MIDKENAILRILSHRCEYCETAIRAQEKEIAERQKQIEYLKAKREGYMQAIDLLNSSLESIKIEL